MTLVALSSLFAPLRAADILVTDGPGNLDAINVAGLRVRVSTSIRMPSRGWTTVAQTRGGGQVTNITFTEQGERQTWSGTAVSGGISFRYSQTYWTEGTAIHQLIELTSLTNQSTEGVFLFIGLPVSFFRTGECQIWSGQQPRGSVVLPDAAPADDAHLFYATGDRVTVADPTDRLLFSAGLPTEHYLTVQDDRYWGGQDYSVFFRISNQLAYGQKTSFQLTFQMTGEPDTSPVVSTVDPLGTGEWFDGWGGNYVFNINSPVTDRLLQELRVSWVRTGMSLRDWEPTNDNSDPTSINDSYFEGRVASSPALRGEFELAQRLKRMGLPWIASVWYLPGWLQPQGDGSKVPHQDWGELEECVGSYLLYAKTHYDVEADYFSFNEPDLGVYALFSPEEHVEAIRQFGEYFQSHGLKTRMLLGDAASPSNPGYITPALDAPGIGDQSGPVAVHTWGSTTPDNYLKWRESARRMKRPLLATEVGSAADAWRYPQTFWKFSYALDDLENYFDVWTWARPRAALLWELTSDYPLIEMSGGQMQPMPRFWFVKQLANLTPAHTEYLSVDSSSKQVRVIAFRGGGDPTEAGVPYAIHIANFGPARSFELRGLPAGLIRCQIYRSSEEDHLVDLGLIEPSEGSFSLQLAAQSLTTLTGRVMETQTHQLRMAQFSQGANVLSTRVVLLNPDPVESASTTVRFRDSAGQLVQVRLMDGSSASTYCLQIPPLGMRVLETTSAGELVSGWVAVDSDRALAGNVLFGGTAGLAGVPSSPVLSTTFAVPIRMVPPAIRTGVAVANLTEVAGEADVELVSTEGIPIAAATLDLEPAGHVALFADEFRWDDDSLELTRFDGSLRITPTVPVAATVLQTQPRELLTLPVSQGGGASSITGAAEQPPSASTLHFAQFADGQGLASSVLLYNENAAEVQGHMVLTGPLGQALEVDINGGLAPEGKVEFSIPPAGLRILATDGQGDLLAGSARIDSDLPLTGVLLFTGSTGAAGVGSSIPLVGSFLLPVFRDRTDFSDTGLAIVNLGSGDLNLDFELRDEEGLLLAQSGLEAPIPPAGQKALYVTQLEWNPEVALEVITGVIKVIPSGPCAATVLLTRQGQFATLPVEPLSE